MMALLVGNLRNPQAYSMNGYLERLAVELDRLGIEAAKLYPEASSATLKAKRPVVKKWLGYLDLYVRFPSILKAQAARHDVVHVTDQGLGALMKWLDPAKTVVTCHDLLAIRASRGELPYWQVGRSGRAYQSWIFKGLSRAQMMPCVSSATSADVQRLFGLAPAQAPVLLNAFYTRVEGQRRQASPPFIHSLAHDQPYKNRLGAFRIGEALLQRAVFQNHRLKMMGGAPSSELAAAIAASPVSSRVDVEVHPADDVLKQRVLSSDLLLFPSLDEGFGLPILEAQSAGCLAAVSNRAPLTEVAGGAAILVQPDRPGEAADAIEQAWPRREAIIQAGRANLDRFSPSDHAAGIVRCYAALTGVRRAA